MTTRSSRVGLLFSACVLCTSAAHSVQAEAAPATSASAAAAAPARAEWRYDGAKLDADRTRVFDLLPTVLAPAPVVSPPYQNWVSGLKVGKPASSPGVWKFSGVRLVRQSLFVPRQPTYETFFEGTFQPDSGRIVLQSERRLEHS